MTGSGVSAKMKAPPKGPKGRCATAGGWPHHPKGGEAVPITITLHILGYTVTIRIKGRNRHSAK